jgi:signal transduction histidine kinase
MKFPDAGVNIRQKVKPGQISLNRLSISEAIEILHNRAAAYYPLNFHSKFLLKLLASIEWVRMLGVTPGMDHYERRKLKVFNLLNLCQLIFGCFIPLTAIFADPKISVLGWVAACMPALVSLVVLYLNSLGEKEIGTLSYFILYPVITSIVYLSGMNLGIELFFILYGILAVFFIQDNGHMIFTIMLSMISYFILTVVWRNFQFKLEVNGLLFLFNHLIAIVFIFFALYMIKKENTNYLKLLNSQADELKEINALKNKLFSVVAHDLKSPMYALRNIFQNVQKYDIPAQDVKAMVPEVMKDLNYTTNLMENLLQWAKYQMNSPDLSPSEVDIAEIAADISSLMNSQAESKNVNLVNTVEEKNVVLAQKDMLRLVLRNLVSNAIKFTPEEGYVIIGTEENHEFVEVFVVDTGIGIDEEHLHKIYNNNYFTTQGTAAEKGTGLGLMLCKEFLTQCGGKLNITSEPSHGSRFSFMLRKKD